MQKKEANLCTKCTSQNIIIINNVVGSHTHCSSSLCHPPYQPPLLRIAAWSSSTTRHCVACHFAFLFKIIFAIPKKYLQIKYLKTKVRKLTSNFAAAAIHLVQQTLCDFTSFYTSFAVCTSTRIDRSPVLIHL